MNKLSVLVTGGAGFIGSNITQFLLENKVKKVRVIDNLSTGNKNNLEPFLEKYDNLEFIYGDISKLEICRKAVKNVDIICHQAALGSVPRSINDPLSSHISNVNGFLNILIAAKEEGIKRVVYASSSSVYGNEAELPKVEEKVGSVLSPYAATKKIDEIYANVFTKCYDMECIGLRYFNVFGPRQDPHGAYAAVIPKFIDIMKNDKQPTINGDGTYSRDFTYVDNVVQGNVLALTTNNKKCFGEVFNIGTGGRVSILELVSNINKYLQKDISPIFGTNRPGDIPHSNADISKAKKMLGYDPKISFKEGILKTLEYYANEKIILAKLNPGSIISKDKKDYIIDYLLHKENNIAVYISKKNAEVCKNFLIPGNKEILKLNYEENNNILEKENNFGIITYDKEFKFGNKKDIVKKPSNVEEPIRILIDNNIILSLKKHFKKLILLNTNLDESKISMKINELYKISCIDNYKSIYFNYNSNDTKDRNFKLYGKFYDAMNIFQNNKIEDLSIEKKILYNWFLEHKKIIDKLCQNITDILNSKFKKSRYLFQENNPFRISINGSTGTPIHQDSQSIIIKKTNLNKFKNGSFETLSINDKILIETNQDKNIFNCNFEIFEEYPEHSMRICENNINNFTDKSYFYKIKKNYENEAILFNPSNRLHYRINQYKGLSIRTDIRIIEIQDYEISDLKNVTGPRMNSNVCFATKKDCSKSKYHVFMDKIYE